MGSSAAARWRILADDEVDGWNDRLLACSASLFQLPYWNEPLRLLRFSPRYLAYRENGADVAFVCLLSLGVPGARIGLIQRGPVALDGGQLPPAAIPALARWARRRGYWFLRFTHSSADLLEQVAALPTARRFDAFPFYREPPTDLLVSQDGSDDQLRARFQGVARREIGKAMAAGYLIQSSTSADDMRAAWPLFQRLAGRKGFNYRPLESFVALMRAAAPHDGARLYTAWLGETLIQAIVVVRDGSTAHYVGGALDMDALNGRDSPSVLLHWTAMRDFARESVRWYNLGSRSGPVYRFKKKFHPLEVDHPQPITVVTNGPLYILWSTMALRLLAAHWRQIKRVAARMLGGRTAAVARPP